MNYNCQQRLRNNIHPSLYLNGNTENIETVGKMPPRVSSGAGCSVQLRDNKPRRSTTAVSTTRSSSLGTRTSAESHSFVGTGNWGHRVLCNTTSHSPSQNHYLFVTHKYCLHMKILLAVRDIVFSYFTYKYFFVTYFFPQGNRSSVSQTAEILLQITEALMFLHTLHYLHCRYPLSTG